MSIRKAFLFWNICFTIKIVEIYFLKCYKRSPIRYFGLGFFAKQLQPVFVLVAGSSKHTLRVIE